MKRRIIKITTLVMISVLLALDVFSVPVYAGYDKVYKQIPAFPVRQWVYAPEPLANFTFGSPTYTDEALLTDPVYWVCYVRTTRADGGWDSTFTGGITPDGDFNAMVSGPAGVTYNINIITREPGTGYKQDINCVFVADTGIANIQKVGTQYLFLNMTLVSINGYYESTARTDFVFTPGMKRFSPEMYDINKGNIMCLYLPGSEVNQ